MSRGVVKVIAQGPTGPAGAGGGGTIPVNEGGTGATTAAGARTNLGVDAAGTAASAVASHAGGTGVHTIAGVTGLQAALDAKVPTTRTVNGHALTADVTLAKSDVGLSNVDNTADANKPVSADQAAADDAILAAAQSYADGLVVGLLDDRGNHDASGNVWPSSGGSGGSGAVLKGDLWRISVAGTLGGTAVTAGDQIRALTDAPGQTAGNWAVVEANLGFVPENSAAKDASGGYAGLSGYWLKLKNAAGAVTSFLASAATSARTWTFPDQDGTVAMTSDITAAAVGLSNVTDHAQTRAAIVPNTAPSAGQLLVGNAGGTAYAPVAVSGDATLASTGALTVANDAITYAKMQDVSATSRVLGRATSGAGDVEELTLSQVLDLVGSAAQGDILYRGASGWTRLGAGTSGQVLQTGGAGANPSWATASGGGATPGGSGTELQYRAGASTLGGMAGTAWDNTTRVLTMTGATLTASAPHTVTQTWNAGGVTFTHRKTNITDTASAAASLIEDWQIGGSTVASVGKDGSVTIDPSATTGAGFKLHGGRGMYAVNNAVGFKSASGEYVLAATGATSGRSMAVQAGCVFGWTASTNASDSPVLGITRDSDRVAKITDGGSTNLGDLKLRNLIATGNFATGMAAKTADYTVTINDGALSFDASGGARTATLPALSTCQAGQLHLIWKTDSSGNAVSADANASETINGSTSAFSTTTQWGLIVCQVNADKSGWLARAL